MTHQTEGLRVKRTRKLLREALIDLIEERGFEALTVGEITARALVSRAAFYRNYQDKYDLVEQIFDEAMQTLLAAVGQLSPDRPPEVWVNFFEHIAAYERLYRALLGKKGSPWFAQKMRAALAEMVKTHENTPNRQHNITPAMLADGFLPAMLSALFVNVITWWLEQGRPYTPLQVAARCSDLALAITTTASTWQ